MEWISSENNQRVRRLAALGTQAKARRQTQSFVIEGSRLVLDAPAAAIQEVYVSESFLAEAEQGGAGWTAAEEGGPDHGPVSGRGEHGTQKRSVHDRPADRGMVRRLLEQHPSYVLKDHLFRKVANTENPQGILAAAREPAWELEDLLHPKEEAGAPTPWRTPAEGPDKDPQKAGMAGMVRAPLLLLLEDIQDPGNLGTMFRTAEAAGATGIIMSRGCVDLFNPKTVRATMSSIFRVPFTVTENLPDLIGKLRPLGVRTYAAYLTGSCPYDEPDYRTGAAFLIGNEGNGLRQETAEAAAERIRIPMEGQIESLNAAMSAGILLYEAHRQRQGTKA